MGGIFSRKNRSHSESSGAERSAAPQTSDEKGQKTAESGSSSAEGCPRNLILYFSRGGENYVNGNVRQLERGNTETLVDFILEEVPADVFRIVPEKDYPDDYLECTKVAKKELRKKERPALREYLGSIDDYDNIVIAAPCWWGNWPCPVMTQLERLDFKGKNVFPVMTHEGSGFGKSLKTLKKTCPGAVIRSGLEVQGSEAPKSEEKVRLWARACLR